jgi:hypothetical protein
LFLSKIIKMSKNKKDRLIGGHDIDFNKGLGLA